MTGKRAGSNALQPKQYFLSPGYVYLATAPAVISTVLGSAVAVCLHDRKKRMSGMNHFLFPTAPSPDEATARYGNAAIQALVRMMIDQGARRRHLEAQLYGGAHSPKLSERNIGRENIQLSRITLSRLGIRIVSEDVGGEKGRKLVYHSDSGDVAIMKVDRLRQADWYPYEGNR